MPNTNNLPIVYASYNGSQKGVTVRNLQLNQLSCFPTPFSPNSITAGPNNDVYLTSNDAKNHLYHYSASGVLLGQFTFPDAGIIYTSVTVRGDRLYASYKGSQQGVTVRDLQMVQLSCFNTGFDANGIAAGPNNDLYLTSGNHIYHYNINGTHIATMTFPDAGIIYTSVSVRCESLYASYKGSQQGVTVRDLQMVQLSCFPTGFDINGIAAGPNNDVYLAATNHLRQYNVNGTLITDMNFPNINYADISVIFATIT